MLPTGGRIGSDTADSCHGISALISLEKCSMLHPQTRLREIGKDACYDRVEVLGYTVFWQKRDSELRGFLTPNRRNFHVFFFWFRKTIAFVYLRATGACSSFRLHKSAR